MPLFPVTAGADLTATLFNSTVDNAGVMAYQGADSPPVNNSTTLVASTYLTIPVVANGFYTYEDNIMYDGNSTANFQYLIVCPNFSSNGPIARLFTSTGGTLTWNADTSLSTAAGGGGVGTVRAVRRSGLLSIGVTGTVSIQFAQNTANASNTILKIGSWIRLTRVG